jgi:hypothetical protein
MTSRQSFSIREDRVSFCIKEDRVSFSIKEDRIRNHSSDAVVTRCVPVTIAIILILIIYGNYAILMRPTTTTTPVPPALQNVTSLTPLPEYPIARGSALELYQDGAWQAGTVTSVREQSRTFAGILANGTMVHGIAHEAFKTTWRLPCMGNKPGDKTLARTSLPNGPKKKLPVPHLTDQFLDRFIVIPEYKLLFCYVEKVRDALPWAIAMMLFAGIISVSHTFATGWLFHVQSSISLFEVDASQYDQRGSKASIGIASWHGRDQPQLVQELAQAPHDKQVQAATHARLERMDESILLSGSSVAIRQRLSQQM